MGLLHGAAADEPVVLAWHFVGSALRDGRPIPPDGEVLIHPGSLEMCVTGLHASERIIDALGYAPGAMICRVECGGKVMRDTDKMICTRRTILWRVSGEALLREFARACARDVLHLWDAPDVIKQYLESGDEQLRAAAMAAAWDARDAAWDARDAAWDARDAAWDARDAAWDARDAAWGDARDAAWDASRAAASWTAAWAAAWDARAASRDARDAAWDAAAMAAQNARLEAMVIAAHEVEAADAVR
jgi:hypothetical protein